MKAAQIASMLVPEKGDFRQDSKGAKDVRCISFLGALSIALATLTCGAVTVLAFPPDNIPYCSSGFEKPARIVLSDTQSMFLKEGDDPEIHFDVPRKVTLSVGDRTEVFYSTNRAKTPSSFTFLQNPTSLCCHQ